MAFDSRDLFHTVHPGFFEKEHIRSLPVQDVYEEQILDLRTFSASRFSVACPENITFGLYKGDITLLHAAVRLVDENWTPYYTPHDDIYCAFDGDRVVSFCLLDDFGTYKGLRIGAPGCVGTIPQYRRKGIGLKMILNATDILKQRGYDLGYIHYTAVGHWYARLGYQTLLKWNANGIL